MRNQSLGSYYRLILYLHAIRIKCCYVEFLKVNFHDRAMWNGSSVCAIHIARVVVWVSRAFQGIFLHCSTTY